MLEPLYQEILDWLQGTRMLLQLVPLLSADTFAPTCAFHSLPGLRIAHPFVANLCHWCTVFLHVHFSRFSSIPRACPRLSSSIAWKRPILWLSVPNRLVHSRLHISLFLHACLLLFHVLDIAFLERLLHCTLRTTLSSKFFFSRSALFLWSTIEWEHAKSVRKFRRRQQNKHGGQSQPSQFHRCCQS